LLAAAAGAGASSAAGNGGGWNPPPMDVASSVPQLRWPVPAAASVAMPLLGRVGRIDPASLDDYRAAGGFLALRRAFEMGPEQVVREVIDAKLLGRGGAAFPTGQKWLSVRSAPLPRYLVCNADESEPGTFKDRVLMEGDPFALVEAMTIAGFATGCESGYLYVRGEYPLAAERLANAILLCRGRGLLGGDVLGHGVRFDVELRRGAGAYICGEEMALINSLEGRRGEPRNKPPFPVFNGLFNKPTVINNVETFAHVPQILVRGVDWYKAQGVNGTAGLKFVGVSGDVMRPGIYEVPMGTPMSELIFQKAGGIPGGKKLKAFAPSGPSAGYLPASMVDVHVDFKSLADVGSMMGSGAVVVCAEDRCMLDMALSATQFFRNESCGKCVPCRVGSQKMVDILTNWTLGRQNLGDMALVDELSEALKLASICGLGQVVPVPIASVLKYFKEEVEAHITRRECPSGVCNPPATAHAAPKATAAPARHA
jgi:NADH:ubiquinone oxidoreductase subunit F (NADH-binding)